MPSDNRDPGIERLKKTVRQMEKQIGKEKLKGLQKFRKEMDPEERKKADQRLKTFIDAKKALERIKKGQVTSTPQEEQFLEEVVQGMESSEFDFGKKPDPEMETQTKRKQRKGTGIPKTRAGENQVTEERDRTASVNKQFHRFARIKAQHA